MSFPDCSCGKEHFPRCHLSRVTTHRRATQTPPASPALSSWPLLHPRLSRENLFAQHSEVPCGASCVRLSHPLYPLFSLTLPCDSVRAIPITEPTGSELGSTTSPDPTSKVLWDLMWPAHFGSSSALPVPSVPVSQWGGHSCSWLSRKSRRRAGDLAQGSKAFPASTRP